MPKILFISNISKRVGSFAICSIRAAKQCEYEYYMTANWSEALPEQISEDEKKYDVKIFHMDLARSPYSRQNIKAYKQLIEFIQREKIDYIHCNTPVGGLLGRLAGKKCGVKKVIYQVHGFHFYQGAPLKNWLLYYPVEKWLAHYTDALITINQEDYEFASKKMKLRHNGAVYYVPGVGIDTHAYGQGLQDRAGLRYSIGIGKEAIVALAAGRLDANKNNKTLVHAVAGCENENLHLVLCGDGEERRNLKSLAEQLNVVHRVHFLGNRSDMVDLYQAADIFVMASYREGLSRSIMEAMASGLPCVVSDIRGNRDLISDGNGGYLLKPNDAGSFAEKLQLLAENPQLRERMREYNLERINGFDIATVTASIAQIYEEVLG